MTFDKRIAGTLAAAALLLASCGVTKRLPEGAYLLSHNRVEIDAAKELPRSQRLTADEAEKYVKQTPYRRFLGTDFYLWAYNRADTAKRGINRIYQRIGQPPVILDSVLTERSAQALSLFAQGRGYFRAATDYSIDTVKRRVRVTYRLHPGEPYRIGNISYDFQDRFIEPIIRQEEGKTLLHPGDIFSVDNLRAEQQRISDNLKDLGYYNFGVNNLFFPVDSINRDGGRKVDIRMTVKQHVAGYDEDDQPEMENNAVYRIRDIYVFPDHEPAEAVRNDTYYQQMDTTVYRGVNFIYRRSLNVKPEVLLRAVNIYPNYLYSATDVRRAYDNLMRLNYFRNVNILFTEAADTTAGENLVTYIGDEAGAGEDQTRESYLTCRIYCTPGELQGFKADIEGTTTSDYYGMLLTVGYMNRNLARGVELFEVNLTGGYEFMRAQGKSNAFEIGGSTAITFPRFVAPIRLDRYNRTRDARTRVEFSLNVQNRPYYDRTLSSATYGYSWSDRQYSSFTFRPIDISVVKMNQIDPAFLDSIKNPFLRSTYTSQLVAGMSGSYTYNNQARNPGGNSIRVRLNGEINGNFLDLVSRMANGKREAGDTMKLFGIKYSQYARADVDASYKFALGAKTSLVYRFYAGVAAPYGNSTLPFERLFYAGGPNSMRGWTPRTLGPGNSAEPVDDTYPSQLGTIKLETNLEFRFPVYDFLNGAVFCDLGNIWLSDTADADPAAVFHFDKFYKQLGFNSGLGARLDFGYFLIRVDWGVRLYNPNKAPDTRWISNLTLRQTAFNIAVNYPF